jgi:membrane protein
MLYFFVICSVLLLVAREAVLRWLGINDPALIKLIDNLRWTVIVLLYFFCISFIYKHAPSVHKKWNLINPGSILATGLMLLMTVAFSWWVASFAQYNQIYGSISTVLIIMILIFVNSLFLLIGFELNVSIQSLLQRAEERKEEMIDPI